MDVDKLNAFADFLDRFKRVSIAFLLIGILFYTIYSQYENAMSMMAGLVGSVVTFYFTTKSLTNVESGNT